MFVEEGGFFSWLKNRLLGAEMTPAGTAGDHLAQEAVRQSYLKELALWTAVGLMADLISSCEIQIFQGDKPVRDGNWYRLNVSPNANQSGADWKSQLVTNLYYDGHALAVPLAGQLYVADAFQVDEYPLLGNRFVNISIGTLQIHRTFRAGDCYYLTQGDRNVKRLVDGMFLDYSELLASASSASKRAGGEKYALTRPYRPSGTIEEQEKAKAMLKKAASDFVQARDAVMPLNRDETLTRLSSGSGSANDLLALRRDVYSMVASALHLPESLLSGNMNNVDQVVSQALTFAIDPLARQISNEITRKTFTQDQVVYGGCRANVDTSALLHVDLVSMAEKLDKLISSGLCCIDEVRRRCNLPELNTDWSQRHYLTKNYGGVADGADPLEGG